MFEVGDKVRNIYTNEIFTVKRTPYWQFYAGGSTSDYTVEFEATETQKTPWDKAQNLELIPDLTKKYFEITTKKRNGESHIGKAMMNIVQARIIQECMLSGSENHACTLRVLTMGGWCPTN